MGGQLNGHSVHMFPKMARAEQILSFVVCLSSLLLFCFLRLEASLGVGVQLNSHTDHVFPLIAVWF